MYSLPTRVTLAALTIASAASTDPIRPRVSISPSASDDMWVMARNSNRLRGMRQLDYHRGTRVFTLVSSPGDVLLPMHVSRPHRLATLGLSVLLGATCVAACKKKD